MGHKNGTQPVSWEKEYFDKVKTEVEVKHNVR
jgi:hypothetical protein